MIVYLNRFAICDVTRSLLADACETSVVILTASTRNERLMGLAVRPTRDPNVIRFWFSMCVVSTRP